MYRNVACVKFDKNIFHYTCNILFISNVIKMYLVYTCPTDKISFNFDTLGRTFYHLMDNVTKWMGSTACTE